MYVYFKVFLHKYKTSTKYLGTWTKLCLMCQNGTTSILWPQIFEFLGSYSGLVCVEVLRPSQPSGVMSSAVSLPSHTVTRQAWSSKRLTSIVHILSRETDNCPSWISGRERMTAENISWSISTTECCRPRRGLNPRPPGLQSDSASNWATEAGYSGLVISNSREPEFSVWDNRVEI